MNPDTAEAYILKTLEQNLSGTLYYHGIHHVRDVVDVAMKLAEAEGVTDEEALALLRTAALYHDAGFLDTYQGHEEEGCRLVRQLLPEFGYTTGQIDQICGMIMATRVPQCPQTHLEQIICDADLDYLGRNDFEPIARSLFDELRARNMVADEDTWNQIQVRFLNSHRYWTPTAIAWRQAGKQAHLDKLRTLVNAQPG
ncbi:hypothetical protein GCM10023189_07380 [Nibrella saemangeumensis]|uniref:HD/PDEase domain-containing protein n=1 Tax=Nibrella saemangeumensis TaxID=1084526 RepID=A0ABP8MDE1_9BACT